MIRISMYDRSWGGRKGGGKKGGGGREGPFMSVHVPATVCGKATCAASHVHNAPKTLGSFR